MTRYLLLLLGFLPTLLAAQSVSGRITDTQAEPLIGASIYWLGTSQGISSDLDGSFEISAEGISDRRLVASYVGYTADTLQVAEGITSISFELAEAQNLEEVVVQGQRDGVIISNLSAIKMEQITTTELGKAACCDLAGCFSSQASVHPQTTNVITNSKELRILGLSGVYNQVLIDGFPMIQGLSFTYGISSIPGTLVNNIYISKGANSVLQGYESISGQINVQTKPPHDTDKLLLNAYINSFGEQHYNANYATKIGNDWTSLTALHSVQAANKIDRDGDNFLDLPLLTRYMVSNQWRYRDANEWGLHSAIGVRFFNERRVGGQMAFDPQTDEGSGSVYGQTVQINQPEFWTKTGYRLNDQQHIVLMASGFHQQQESFFGTVRYDAQQSNFYANAQYEHNYGQHNIKTGFSFRYLDLQEDIAFMDGTLGRTYDGNYRHQEQIPGVFAENTMRLLDGKLTWIAGIRADRHNEFGTRLTPRTLLKYDISPNAVLRANVGTGWRTVNLFSENINLLVSSRDIVFAETLQPEEALNYGVNFTQKFDGAKVSGYLSFDYYRTDFRNQIFPDYDSSPTEAVIRNYDGTSIGDGFQAEAYAQFWQRLELKAGYNYLDVYRMEEGKKVLLPFNAKHKMVTTMGYKPLSRQYQLDLVAHWYGEQRLPNTSQNPSEFQRPGFSEPYVVVNAQVTYNFKSVEVYGGCENLFNFRQERPILSWQNPFGPYFDTSSVWGPTRGRELYLGARYYLREK